jgi:AcrR family transcriptional regulator
MTRPANPTLPGKILDTAEGILAREGLDALNMRRLAEVGGVTPTTLYYYFDSKDHILNLLRIRAAKRLNGKLQRMKLSDPETALVELADGYIAFAEENPRLYRLLVEPPPGPSSAWSPEERGALQIPYSAVESILDTVAQRGARTTDKREKAMAAWIMLHGFVSLLASGALEKAVELDREGLKAKFLEIYAENVRRGESGGEDASKPPVR